MDNHENNKDIIEFLVEVPEFYCLEDYGNCTMIQVLNNFKLSKKRGKPENYIALIFFSDNKEKQIFAEIKSLKKNFLFIKVLNEGRDMNFLIKRKENYTGNEILSEINNMKYLKTPIKAKLDIFEFPLKNYSLYEKNKTKIDINIDIIYEIKCLNQTYVDVKKFIKENKNKTDINREKKFSNNNNLKNDVGGDITNNEQPKNFSFNTNNNNMNNNCISSNNINSLNNNRLNSMNFNINMNNFNNMNNNMNIMNNNMNFMNNNMNIMNNNMNFMNNNMNLNNINFMNNIICNNMNNFNCNNNMNNINFNRNFTNNNIFPNNNFMCMNPNNNLNYKNIMMNNQMNLFQNNLDIKSMNNLISYKMNIKNKSTNNSSNNEVNKDKESINSIVENIKNIEFFPLKGLDNVGMTCYMNSTLQCLLHISELNDYFINKYPNDKEKLNKINQGAETKGILSKEYYEVVKGTLFKENSSYSYNPKNFNKTLSGLNPQFARFESNDSKDLLLYLFQSLHEELNYLGSQKLKNVPKCNQLNENESLNFFETVNSNLNFSIISCLFYGILKSKTNCTTCNSNLFNFQYFQFLSFPLYNFEGDIFNIYKGFKEFIMEENMTGNNQCYCQICHGLRDAKVSSIIYSTPPYLIINFDYGKDKKYNPKNVEFGEVISLEMFLDKNCTKFEYDLVAVSSHRGRSGNSGHYVAYCKDQKRKWHEFNDSTRRICDFNEVKSYSPYFLIFKRRNKSIIPSK